MARAERIPKWQGKNTKALFSLDDQQTTIDVVSWKATQVADVSEDDFCGRDRTDTVVNTKYFEIELQIKQTKLEVLERYLVNTENEDANTVPLSKWIALKIAFNDGTQKGLAFSECTLLPWEMNAPDRKQRNEMPVKVRAQYVKTVTL